MIAKFNYCSTETVQNVPGITVSQDDIDYVEKLRHDMPLVNKKVPSVKKTIELVLKFIEENRSDFMRWTEEKEK